MEQVDEDLKGLAHYGVLAAALDVDHEADAARVVLVAGIVETGGGRWGRHRNGVLSRTAI